MADNRLDRAASVREGEELNLERLQAYLAEVLPEVRGDLEVEQFPSGFSNLTYLIRMGEAELVLRRPPFGSKVRSAHDMGREFRVLSQLTGVYPKAPGPLAYCDDADVLGAPFYVMERVEGFILRPGVSETEAPAANEMASIGRALVETLAELHAVDYEAAGLAELGKPEGYVRRQIDGWSERYRRARTDELVELERAAAWLGERQPSESGASLIHNDFKYDNLVLDPDDPTRVRAVLDWEMATLGDPLADLGYTLIYWLEPGDPRPPGTVEAVGAVTAQPGFLSRVELVEAYAKGSGRDLAQIDFYQVLALTKLAVISEGIFKRFQLGKTAGEGFDKMTRAAEPLARRALTIAEGSEDARLRV